METTQPADTAEPMSSTGAAAFPTIGILGGGQLGRMMTAAAIRMGVHVRLLSPKPAGPMASYADAIVDDWTDREVLAAFAAPCDVITVESEWAPAAEMAEVLPPGTALWPRPETIDVISHKGIQKTRLADAGLPVPSFRRCATLDEALAAAEELGYPVVLKMYRGSYDGYGNATVDSPDALRENWNELADEDGLMVEAFMEFERELAVQVARRPDGEQVVYPVAHTVQRNHRCHAVIVPAEMDAPVSNEAQRVAQAAVDAVDGVGLTAVELFEMPDGRVLVNELAPRPHNTGHYSIEGCYTSQFENHVRAILGWPLGSTALRAPVAVMVNVLGRREGTPPRTKGLRDALSVPGATVHVYNKPEVRPARKMGHVTVTGTDRDDVYQRAEDAAGRIRL
jgi:5-(carboxyamino)imidazole ribonucleotide synthase